MAQNKLLWVCGGGNRKSRFAARNQIVWLCYFLESEGLSERTRRKVQRRSHVVRLAERATTAGRHTAGAQLWSTSASLSVLLSGAAHAPRQSLALSPPRAPLRNSCSLDPAVTRRGAISAPHRPRNAPKLSSFSASRPVFVGFGIGEYYTHCQF